MGGTTDRPVGRLRRGAGEARRTRDRSHRCRAPTRPSRVAAAASGSSTRRSTRSPTRGYRDTAVDDIAGAAETSKGGIYFHFPTKEVDLPRADGDDRRQARRAGRAGGRARDRAGRPGRGGDPRGARRRSPGTGRWRGCCSSTRWARGACSRRRRTPSTTGSRRLIEGYLDEAVAAGAIPPIDTRITSIAWFGALNEVVARWLLADHPGRLEDAYPALCARSCCARVGVPEARIGRCRCPRPRAGRSRRRRDDGRAAGRGAGRARRRRARRAPGGAAAAGDRALNRALASATVAVAVVDPIALFAAAVEADLEAALWLRPSEGTAFVGIGRAWAVEPDGPDRFATAEARWRELLAAGARRPPARCAARRRSGAPGRRSGSPAASPDAGDAWAPFGAASLVLPELAAHAWTAARARLVTASPSRRPRRRPPPSSGAGAGWSTRARELEPEPERHRRPAGVRAARRSPTSSRRTTAWDRLVGMFAGAVGRGRIDKVVLARRVGLRSPVELDVPNALRRLAASAPESTIFAFRRDGRTFLGATPERLVAHRGPVVPDGRGRGHRSGAAPTPPEDAAAGRRAAGVGEGPRGARDRRRLDPRPAGADRRHARGRARARRHDACASSSTS